MAFWWVFQNASFKEEKEGSYLWAPKESKNKTKFYWKNMEYVQEGDIIFSSYRQRIVAVSTATSKAYNFPKPFATTLDKPWEKEGNKVDLNFHELNNVISYKLFSKNLLALLNVYHGPINKKGTGNQGYLFSISDKAGSILLKQIEEINQITFDQNFCDDIDKTNAPSTTKVALIESRKGQGKYRDDLIKYWEGKCAVTGCNLTDILIASHIKPWKVANNYERLDPSNGLLLSPNYDKLFDKGYISFGESGKIIISSQLDIKVIKLLNINIEAILNPKKILTCLQYLNYHQSNVFIK